MASPYFYFKLKYRTKQTVDVCGIYHIDKFDKIGDRRTVIHFNLHKEVAMKYVEAVANIVCATLLDPKVLQNARRRKNAFTRNNRYLPYWTMMKLLLCNMKDTIAATLDGFFKAMHRSAGSSFEDTDIPVCTQQAFSKARGGINHTIFQECFNRVLDFLCAPEAHEYQKRLGGLWGIQVIAIDGSRIPLPSRKVLLTKYGGTGANGDSPTALASIAYDVLNDLVLDAHLEPLSVGERSLAIRHMEAIKNKSRANLFYTIFVFDRGYASQYMMTYIEEELQSKFLFRLRDKFNLRIDALPKPDSSKDIIDHHMNLYPGRKVRVLRFYLPSGTLETLITNEFDHDANLFKELYFLRWPCEEEYKLIKVKVGLTCFRGWAENSILQEFWIAILVTNLVNVITRETDGIIKCNTGEYDASRTSRFHYKTNKNETVGVLSRYFPDYMDADTESEKQGIIKHIFKFLIIHKVIDKKGTGESSPRNEPRKARHHMNVKTTH